MNILVTGGAGFIGSNLVDRLLNLGHKVTVVDNEKNGSNRNYYWNSKSNNFKMDINDSESFPELFKGINVVFHFAAETSIRNSILEPSETIKINVLGTQNVLENSRLAGVERVIFSSTSAIYGKNPTPNHEDQSPDCSNPYSASKLSGEILCKMYSQTFGLPTIILRYFNVYGERQITDGDNAPVIGSFISKYRNQMPIHIYGDGSAMRDFVSVNDVVEANILASNIKIDHPTFSCVLNIGSGKGYSISEIANLFNVPKIRKETILGESEKSVAKINKAEKLLNWVPKESVIAWVKNKIDEIK